ncbi:MAG TPA: nucleoside triphosphate pyrophosphohydrolase [Kiritimatiellia bacterium]|nr:nucleoside triphosphate pyrophosphohydrolase [Kiritimatiellia bacterium]
MLRSERGCPWDREQTLATLREHLIEETYEVADAMAGSDRSALREELGDLLLQIVFQSQLCSEEQAFTFDDVAQGIVDKLVRRHPHVFGDVKADNPAEVLKNWEAIKKREKGETPRSAVEGIPRSLPALHRAHLLQKRAARVGFDWEHVRGAIDKVEEELEEIKKAMEEGNENAIREEIGDLLFAGVNVSRFFGHNAEDVLEATIEKFSRRFQRLEDIVHERGQSLTDCTLEELEVVWTQVKGEEKGSAPENT